MKKIKKMAYIGIFLIAISYIVYGILCLVNAIQYMNILGSAEGIMDKILYLGDSAWGPFGVGIITLSLFAVRFSKSNVTCHVETSAADKSTETSLQQATEGELENEAATANEASEGTSEGPVETARKSQHLIDMESIEKIFR